MQQNIFLPTLAVFTYQCMKLTFPSYPKQLIVVDPSAGGGNVSTAVWSRLPHGPHGLRSLLRSHNHLLLVDSDLSSPWPEKQTILPLNCLTKYSVSLSQHIIHGCLSATFCKCGEPYLVITRFWSRKCFVTLFLYISTNVGD